MMDFGQIPKMKSSSVPLLIQRDSHSGLQEIHFAKINHYSDIVKIYFLEVWLKVFTSDVCFIFIFSSVFTQIPPFLMNCSIISIKPYRDTLSCETRNFKTLDKTFLYGVSDSNTSSALRPRVTHFVIEDPTQTHLHLFSLFHCCLYYLTVGIINSSKGMAWSNFSLNPQSVTHHKAYNIYS